jgi:hypothetical protein
MCVGVRMSHATMSITKPARSVGAALLLALLVCLLFGRWVALVPGVGIETVSSSIC